MNDYDNKVDVKQFLSLLGITSVGGEIDDGLIVESGGEDDRCVYINVEKRLEPVYCSNCQSRMYSKGAITRKVKHPILQNGKLLIINLKQRKYRCTNKECNCYFNEEFGFVEKYKQTSVTIPYLILSDMKDISLTCAAVSRRYQVSDTYVHSIMMRYFDFKPLPLSEIISIDEVFLDIEYDQRYAVIIRDFISGDLIDVLPNRYDQTLSDFFRSYPYEERKKVKYIISDMYDPYLSLPKKFMPSATSIIDSFHVIQLLEKAIRAYIDKVKKRYQKKLDEERKENNYFTNRNYKTRKDSVEITLLKRHKWVLLCKRGNEPDISSRHYSRALDIYPTVERIQKMFMDLDPMFEPLKQLKDKYLDFNDEYVGKPDEARVALRKLIEEYRTSDYQIYKEFADLLDKHFERIIMSFRLVKRQSSDSQVFYQRLSNGPMEGFNRKPKDMKRMARGYTNFGFVRNRILWSSRKNAAILAVPKEEKEIRRHTGRKRGPYKKKK